MHDSTRSALKKNEQLNASKRLIEEQEDEIMVRCFAQLVKAYSNTCLVTVFSQILKQYTYNIPILVQEYREELRSRLDENKELKSSVERLRDHANRSRYRIFSFDKINTANFRVR
jgi:subtilase family serine protease